MAASPYTIAPMSPTDLDCAIDWAAAEGWNPGLGDRDSFYTTDPQGFLMGMLAGEPIASISVVKYDDRFGFLGFYIVRPEFRGQGYGWQLWQAGLDYLAGGTIGLDGVVAQQDNYLKSGFQLAYRNIRYQGVRTGKTVPPKAGIVPLASLPFETVLAYDRAHFPSDRATFLQRWITQPGSTAIGILQHQTLAGYGVIRPCRQGFKIGPLFADTPDQAEILFLGLKAQVPVNEPFYLDVPEVNLAAVALAERYAMAMSFETTRMYRGPAPKLPVERIFGVTTFELG